MVKKSLIRYAVGICFFCVFFRVAAVFAYEKVITIPAESSQGVTVNLGKGSYLVEIAGGAVSLFYPINPNYCWLVGAAIGTEAGGGQDNPDIGTVYFEPYPSVDTQSKAEEQALDAVKDGVSGTSLRFSLAQDKSVRFWVSDFDYSDNSGMIKLKITRE